MFEIFNNSKFWNSIKGNTIYCELTPREMKVLEFRLVEKMTLEKIAQELEVTRERIRQIEAKGLEKIRKNFIIKN